MSMPSPVAYSAAVTDVAEVQRAFMSRVYLWMFVGLGITGAVAWYTALTPQLLRFVLGNILGFVIAEFALVIALSRLAPRLGGLAAAGLFLLYAVFSGLTLSAIFLIYEIASIGQVFLMTAGVFGAMSVYGTVTRRDLSAWRTFLMMGLIGIIVAGVINFFLASDGFSFVIACATVVVFAGLTAYDTQKLRNFHAASGYSSAASLSIVGALILYLDFINLFLALLRLFARRR